MASSASATPSIADRPVWPQAINIILALGLACSALLLNPHPAGLMWSELLSSLVIVAGSALAWSTRFRWMQWIVACVGLWLMCAPLVFWAPTAVAYGIDTLTGTLVVAFSVLIPAAVTAREVPGPAVPPGWDYNPSAWTQRLGIIACAFLQFFIARHMAAFQLGHTTEIWDPVFGDGTRNVLHSDVSRAFPVSDAGLGAVTYLVEALTGFLGGTRRWRTMPWAVVLFGIMIVPVGVVSIVLVVLQPVAVGAWCFWCLLTAGITVVMIAPAVDELVATGQFLLQARREGQSTWQVFWRGGTTKNAASENEAPRQEQSLLRQLAGGMELTAIPWNLAACAGVGLWLMAAPVVLENSGASANNNHLVGALVVTFAAIGFGEAARAGRLVNVLFGAWLLVAPHLLAGGNSQSWWNDLAVGAAVILLTLRRGEVTARFGSWDRWVV